MANDENRPIGKRKRFFKLASMTASVAGNYAKTAMRGAFQNAEDAARDRATSYAQSGERIAQTLGELKGAAMKLGQMASITSDVLPKEIQGALKKLQKEAPPVPFSVIADQIQSEFGSPPEMLFDHFEEEPFASASIGQVHRARVDDGREVVVKVQYPGVDSTVDSDLTHLKLAIVASGMARAGTKENLDALFHEIRARLHEELDYCNEADNVRMFREFHKDHDYVVVPQVVGERSSQRVLTLTYEPGDDINELDAKDYSQEARNLLGKHLYHITLEQIFRLKALQADPNPANFAFRPDGTVVMYDFGCVKKIKPDIVEAYGRTIRCAIEEDYDGVEQGMLDIGARRPDGPPIEAEYYKMWRDTLLIPFTSNDVFDYGASVIHDEVKRLAPTAIKRLASFQPPIEVVFIDRVVAGHYGNLRNIRARGAFLDIVLPYLEPDAASGEA